MMIFTKKYTTQDSRIASIILLVILFFFAVPVHAQVPVSIAPPPKLQFFDANGAPLAGGCVFFFVSGTSTPAPTYVDSTGTILNTNPVILDGGGFASIWLANQAYDVAVWSQGSSNCSSGVQQYKILNINSNTALLNSPNVWTATQTFNGGLSGTGSLGTLTAGPGILATVNTWSVNQIFNSLTSSTANPSLVGSLRLAQSDSVGWRNAANTSNLTIAPLAAAGNIPADTLTTANGYTAPAFISNTSNIPAATGSLRLNAGDSACWRNAANSGDVCVTKDGSDHIVIPGATLQLICTVTMSVTVTNSTSLSPLQTCTIPANNIDVGGTYMIVATGRIAATGTPTFGMNLLVDSTPIDAFSMTLAAAIQQPWTMQGTLTGLSTGVSGSITSGDGIYSSTPSGGGIQGAQNGVAPSITLDTTATHTITVQVVFGTASASNTVTEYTLLLYKIG